MTYWKLPHGVTMRITLAHICRLIGVGLMIGSAIWVTRNVTTAGMLALAAGTGVFLGSRFLLPPPPRIDRKLLTATLCALCVGAGALHAQSAPSTVSWYMANPGVLYGMISWCHDSAGRADTVTCRNADTAATGLLARNYRRRSGLAATLGDPAWWAADPVARKISMARCAAGGIGNASIMPWCPAIAASYRARP